MNYIAIAKLYTSIDCMQVQAAYLHGCIINFVMHGTISNLLHVLATLYI